jgi:hypothetical protein
VPSGRALFFVQGCLTFFVDRTVQRYDLTLDFKTSLFSVPLRQKKNKKIAAGLKRTGEEYFAQFLFLC